MYSAFVKLLNMSASSAIGIFAVILLRLLLKKVPKKYICLLWAIAAVRLIVPFSFSSALSVFNYIGMPSQNGGQVEFIRYNGKSEKPKGEIPVYSIPIGEKEDPAAQAKPADLYLPTAIAVWAAGCAGMLCYAVISYGKLRRLTAASLRLRRNIYLCDSIPSPFILGMLRPKIYLPSCMTKEQAASVIAHERAHLARLDHWWKPMGFCILSVHWFNPLVWIGYALLCRDIEAACDERVIMKMDNRQKQAYSETLLQCSLPQKAITACPLAFGETGVKQRIRGILNYRKPTAWIIAFSLLICMLTAASFLTDPVKAEITENAGIRYELTIGQSEGDITYLAIEYPGGSGGCANADESAFRLGEKVWLEPLDGLENLKGVAISARDAHDQVLWRASFSERIIQADVFFDNGWMLHRIGDTEVEENIVLTGPMIMHSGDLTYTLPEGMQYTYSVSHAPENGDFVLEGETVGGVRLYTVDEATLLTGMDWVRELALPEREMTDVVYFVDGPEGGPYTLEIFSDVPVGAEQTVSSIHHLYCWQGTLYDLWFDTLKLNEEIQNQILNLASVSIPAGDMAGTFRSQIAYNLYSAPSETSRVIGILQPEESFLISNEEEIAGSLWAYGTMAEQDIIGWINMGAAEPAPEASYDPVIYITEEEYTLHSSPANDAGIIGKLSAGEAFMVLRVVRLGSHQWFYVSAADQDLIGWMQFDGVLTASGGGLATQANEITNHLGAFGVVNTDGETPLNVRSGPGMSYAASFQLASGSAVQVFEVVENEGARWGRIGEDQWVLMNDISMIGTEDAPEIISAPPTAEQGIAAVGEAGAELKSSPSSMGRTIGTLQPGDAVVIRKQETIAGIDWYYIAFGDTMLGWVQAESLLLESIEG